jgi:hypothetical protein
MFRTAFCSAAVLMIYAGSLQAADKASRETQGNNVLQGVFVKADVTKNAVIIKTTNKEGKTSEKTLMLARGARVLGENDLPVTIAAFAKYMDHHKDKSILVLQAKGDGDVLEIMDLPSKSQETRTNRVIRAVFVKADAPKHTVTFQTTDQDGKIQEQTAALAKDAKVLGENDLPVTIARFATYMDHHKDKSILVLQGKGDGAIHEIMDVRSKE